jgi:type II secretory ATPase GspE/PulE/Tfp pilus assembly ATPase PilB-like protein
MNRLIVAWAVIAVALSTCAGAALAQQPNEPTEAQKKAAEEEASKAAASDAAWGPSAKVPAGQHNPLGPDGKPNWRGPGWYASWWKVLLIFLVMLLWVRTTDWVGRDTGPVGLPYEIWNPVAFFPFFALFFITLFIPIFWVNLPVLALAWIVPLGIYIQKRNGLVAEADKVLTRDHIRHSIANLGQAMGAKVSTEKKLPHERGAPVVLVAMGAKTDQKNQANLIEARQSQAYITLKEIVANAIDRRADRVLLEYTADTVVTRLQIDGVWLDVPLSMLEKWAQAARGGKRVSDVEGQLRDVLDPVAMVMKRLANLKPEDRRGKQEGLFSAEYQGSKFAATIASQGTATGERVILTLAGKSQKFASLDDLGMREKMRDQLKELLAMRSGIIVLSAMPQGGLSHTMQFALKSTDRLLRDFAAVGEKTRHEPEVENVEVTSFDSAAGETALTVLPKLILKQPDVLVIRELTDGETLRILLKQAEDDHPKLSITTIRAKEAVEAVARVLALKVPATEVAPHLLAVLNQRLIRKLCEKCKESFEPSEAMLAKLGIPKGRVELMYRERQPLPPDSREKRLPCEQCGDIGFFGRTSIYELLVINDKFREAMVKDPRVETLKKVARAGGHRGLQQEGIALVALGITSLSELQRVLKQ